MHGPVVDGRQGQEVLPPVPLVVGVRVVGAGRVAVEALVAGGHQLPRCQFLDVRAGLRDPGEQPLPGLVTPAARLVGQLEGHDGRVLVVAQPGVPVVPGQHVLHVGAVAVLDRLRAVEQVVVGPGPVGVIGQPEEPLDVLGHAAVVGPVVDQRQDQPEAQLAGLVDGVVQGVEGRVVIDVGLRLERRVAVTRPVRERPRPDHGQGHRRRVVQGTVDHVVRLLVQVVGVSAAEPPPAAPDVELAVPGGHEVTHPAREGTPGGQAVAGGRVPRRAVPCCRGGRAGPGGGRGRRWPGTGPEGQPRGPGDRSR